MGVGKPSDGYEALIFLGGYLFNFQLFQLTPAPLFGREGDSLRNFSVYFFAKDYRGRYWQKTLTIDYFTIHFFPPCFSV